MIDVAAIRARYEKLRPTRSERACWLWSGAEALCSRTRSWSVRLDDASSCTLKSFIQATIAPGANALTDRWQGYVGVTVDGRGHVAYRDEFEFRFSRCHATSRTLLFQRALSCAVATRPPRYGKIVGRTGPCNPVKSAA